MSARWGAQMGAKMKRIIVIGGGIAGLSAGIYALQEGFEVAVYERNSSLGGECTGWNRQGYHIDNCIHWLTGCRPGDDLNKIWKNIGAVNDATEFYREPYFYKLEMDGKSLCFWRDLERARREFLNAAPEDSRELERFFDSVKYAEGVRIPCEKSLAEMGAVEYMKFGMTMAGMGRVIREYGRDTIADLANRFQNPYVKAMMGQYYENSRKAVALISSYAFYTSGTAAIPAGGSVGMVQRMVNRFEELGGKIYTNMPAEKVKISDGRAEAVDFADGSSIACDFVICAVDTSITFGKLIGEKYMDKNLRKMYETRKGYKASSSFNASFGIDGEKNYGLSSGSLIFPCDSFTVGRKKVDFMGMRLYDYDETLFPMNRRVIQCSILQDDDEDFAYWHHLYGDKERYNAEKMRIAGELQSRITEHFPMLAGRLFLLDTYSPMTFVKWCSAYRGSYMSFYEQMGYKSLAARNRIKGLSNVFVASQWLATNGGLPLAATSGKFAVDSILRSLK